MTVELARKAAQKIKGQLAERKNPLREKEKIDAEKTFGEAFEMYINRHVRVENKSSILKDIEFRMRKVLPHWSCRPLSFITRSEIQNMHEQIGEKHGIYEANRVLSYVCAIYKSPQSTAIYARLSNDPVRASMESALDFYRK